MKRLLTTLTLSLVCLATGNPLFAAKDTAPNVLEYYSLKRSGVSLGAGQPEGLSDSLELATPRGG
ncbi:MAG: hypothetical protein K2Z81_11435, partial [Cyanobacteria bacterium]|nr:hypothetical protein [Cyanobacteriota bacterium]